MTREGGDADPATELSVRAVAFGLVTGALLAAGNVYAGLKLGITDGGMTTVVLLSFATFAAAARPLGGRESNAAQVAGSSAAGMAVTAGLCGPIPALAMSGDAPAPVWVALWGVALAVLGTLLAVPFRRQLIEDEALPFPSGQAAGELIAGLAAGTGKGRSRVRVLFVAAGFAVGFTLVRDAWHLLPGDWMLPVMVAGVPAASLAVGVSLSPLVLGIGTLVGARIGLSLLAGGVVAWVGLAPVLAHRGLIASADYGAGIQWLLWPGAALMVASTLTALALSAGSLWRAWTSRRAERSGSAIMRVGVILCAVLVIAMGWAVFGVSPVVAALALVLAGVFSIVGLRAAGETDQAPCGPLGGLTQVIVGAAAPGGVVSPLFSGGVVNGAVSHSSSMMQSWKAGRILGNSPGRLLLAQLSGVGVGAAAATVAYLLLERAYGIGTGSLPAPAALSWKATADVVKGGISAMPPGAALAALVAAGAGVVLALGERGRIGRYLPSAVGLGIGFVVPVTISSAAALGALGFVLVRRIWPDWADRHGAALASGLISGEALTAVVLAGLVLAGVLSGG